MKKLSLASLLLVSIQVVSITAVAQTADTASLDPRLPVHTIVREDAFAGVLSKDMERLARAEANIEKLLLQRPDEKPSLLAWKGIITMYRAVWAHEGGREDEFKLQYDRSLAYFSEASRTSSPGGPVSIIKGGTLLLVRDRLPESYRFAAAAEAYDQYRLILKNQAPVVEKLPLHMKGELLAGLAESAYLTNHPDEEAQYLSRIVASMPNTPYAVRALKWQQNPELASHSSLICQTCHEDGRLAPRMAALSK